MRIVLVSPHIDNLVGVPVVPAYMGARFSPKYNWLRLLCDMKDINVAIYLDNEWTSAAGYFGDALSRFNLPANARAEYCLVDAARWCQLSGFPADRVEFLQSPEQVRSGDIVVAFANRSLGDLTIMSRPLAAGVRDLLARRDIVKIAHLSHYQFHTSTVAKNAAIFQFDSLCYEANLTNYPFFRKFFPGVHKVDIVPFAFKDRFQVRMPFALRKNRCVATGFTQLFSRNIGTVDILDFFRVDTLHPIRWAIINNVESLDGLVDSQITTYNSEYKLLMENFPQAPLAEALSCNMSYFDEAKKRTEEGSYFTKFDIVKLFNDYKMVVIGEELNHSPGIGFVEAMACGTALVAIDDPMYRDLGLIPGEHYVAYDGTLEGLKHTVRYYQQHEGELEKIAAKGCELVRTNFSEAHVAQRLVNLAARLRAEHFSRNAPSTLRT